jgi:hypothetical protein
MSGRKLLNRSNEFLGVDQKVWLGLETGGFGDDAVTGLVPGDAGAVDFSSCNITYDIPRDDSPSRSGRSVVARLSGKKTVEVSVESMIIPGNPDVLGNPTLPPMHPLILTAFGDYDFSDPAKIVYELSRFNGNSARILEESTHYARLTVGVIIDAITFSLPGDDKATMKMEGFAQDSYLAGETVLAQAITGTEQLASLIIQDLTYTAKITSGKNGNLISIVYIGGATAGAEVVTVVGNAITVQIETNISTATEVKTAVDANLAAAALVTVAISGTAGDAQVIAPVAYLAGGLGTNDFKVATGKGILIDIGSYVDILDADGDTMINQKRLVVAVAGKAVREDLSGPNSDVITVDGLPLVAADVNDIVIGHAPETYSTITAEKALLGLKGTLTVAGVNIGACEMISAEIALTNNYTKKDFIYGTGKMCGFIPDKRREVSLSLELLLNKETLSFYMRNKCFVAEDVTITLEPQDICAPAYSNSTGRTFEFKLPKVEFNIPPIENPADAYVTLSLEGKALAPSANDLDEEFTLTIK